MGKAKKLKRLEKAKVKLKAKKLPKGLNITDTSFKTRKIVIPEQLRQVNEEELLTKKKLNVQGLLAHLKHHNVSVRQDGISGLKELITLHSGDVIRLNLPEIVDGISQLVLDLETDVRRNSLKLIEAILLKISSEQIVPLFDVLQSYMACAMTHIKPSIQEDSLLLLDSLLEVCPNLIADKAEKILPSFLDMISSLRNESKPDRKLVVNLSNKLTSVRWRIKVLSRLNKFFDAIVTQKKQKKQLDSRIECKTVKWDERTPIYAAQHMTFGNFVCRMPQVLCRTSTTTETEANECEMLKQHIQGLIPLLFETWIEAAPEGKNVEVNILSEENARLLQCILGTIQSLWEFLEYWEDDAKISVLTSWFKEQYEDDLLKHFLPGFPYMLSEYALSKKGKKKKQEKQMKTEKYLLQDSVVATSNCVQQNLSLCYLLTCIHKGQDVELTQKVTVYIQECLNNWESEILLPQLDLVLRALLLKRGQTWTEGSDILQCVVKCHKSSSDEKLQQTLFYLLCDVILQPDCHHNWRCVEFEEWICELPDLLCQPTISKKTLDALTRLACQNNNVFMKNLLSNYTKIIGALTIINVIGVNDQVDGLKDIVNILFRAGELDSAVFDQLLLFTKHQKVCAYIQNLRTFKNVMYS